MIVGDFVIAEEAYWACNDFNSLLLIATCLGDKELLEKVA